LLKPIPVFVPAGIIGGLGTAIAAMVTLHSLRSLEALVLTAVVGGLSAWAALELTDNFFYAPWQISVSASLAYSVMRARF
jgi:hypothetical protein